MIHYVSEIQVLLGVGYFHLQNLATLSKPSSERCGKGKDVSLYTLGYVHLAPNPVVS